MQSSGEKGGNRRASHLAAVVLKQQIWWQLPRLRITAEVVCASSQKLSQKILISGFRLRLSHPAHSCPERSILLPDGGGAAVTPLWQLLAGLLITPKLRACSFSLPMTQSTGWFVLNVYDVIIARVICYVQLKFDIGVHQNKVLVDTNTVSCPISTPCSYFEEPSLMPIRCASF